MKKFQRAGREAEVSSVTQSSPMRSQSSQNVAPEVGAHTHRHVWHSFPSSQTAFERYGERVLLISDGLSPFGATSSLRKFLRAVVLSTGMTPLLVAPAFAEDTDPSRRARGEKLPDLERVLAVVADNAPEIQRGKAFVNASRATMVGAKLPPIGNPDFQVFGESGNVDGSNVTRDVFIDGTMTVPWEIWGQRSKRIRESEAYTGLAQATLGSQKASALAGAVTTYGNIVVSHARIDVLRDTIQIASDEAEIYQARAEAGDATVRDSRVAMVELARNRVLLAEAQADLRTSLAALTRLTKKSFETHPDVSPEPPWRRPPPPTGGTELPTVKQSQAEAEYYRRASERARAEGKMPFGLIFRLGRGDFGEMRLGGGLAFALPLFRRNQGERALAEANAEQAEAVATIEKQALEAALEGAILELEQLEDALLVIDRDALPAARDAVQAAEEIQRAGKSDILPVLISRRDYAALRLRRLDILGRMWNALGRIVLIRGIEP